MKKLVPYLFFTLIISQFANAQFFYGLRSSNWGGVTNISYNPAIADNRYKFDMNIIAAGVTFSNNYLGFKRSVLFNPSSLGVDSFQYKGDVKEFLNGRQKNVYQSFQIQGPLSFIVSFGKYNRNAIGVSYHANFVTNFDGVGEEAARFAYYGLTGPSVDNFRNRFSNKDLSINAMGWMDYGLTYSRVIIDEPKHMFKLGGTLKLLQGLGAAYMYSNNFEYQFNSDDTLNIYNTDVSYGHSRNFNFTQDGYKPSFDFKQASPTVGADLGFVYEYRPNKEKYRYTMDGRDDNYRRDQNLYLLQAGFTVTDIGAVNFARDSGSQDLHADIRDWYIKNLNFTNGVNGFDDTLRAKFDLKDTFGVFKVWLPTRFNFWLDVNVGKGFGFNASATISPVIAGRNNQVHHLNTFGVTPHYDHAWFGAYLPFSFNNFGNVNLGVTLRMGPVIIGTQDILGLFAKKYIKNADVHIALKIPIPYAKPRDRDKDGVSNKKDRCKKDPGPWITRGCPDKDNDSIVDKDDKCPDVAGLKQFKGCPDTDGDGIPDNEDSCVLVKGLAQFNGCPDTDADGIVDSKDECPDQAGPAVFNGCPDKDNDSIPDKADECPDQAGPRALKGCPDKDNDGVADKNDKCPDVFGTIEHAGCPDTDGDGVYDDTDPCINVKGPRENNGCPWPDTDNDGIPDKDDACPTVFGLPETKGCPKLEKKELETVKYAFDNLEFETGKDIIRTKSYISLNSLADLLIKKSNYGLKIEGHTDNVGTAEKNQTLSEKRAAAVKAYLVKRGVDASKLETYGYGMTKPIADNKTAAGRQKNRRVEMTITFK